MNEPLIIAGHTFSSRLLVGTGKFASPTVMHDVIMATGSQIVTVAIRRVDLTQPQDPVLEAIPQGTLIVPNTSGARNAEEAIRIGKIAKASGLSDWIKLEITPDPNHLLPDATETLIAAKLLVAMGFKVLPYIAQDPILAKRLEELGTAAVMPLAAPIGSNAGITDDTFLRLIIANANIPVIIDAGLGAPSHVARAMELGADAVLINTSLASARHPIPFATAMRKAVEAGRMAYESGLPSRSATASASSPLTGFLQGA